MTWTVIIITYALTLLHPLHILYQEFYLMDDSDILETVVIPSTKPFLCFDSSPWNICSVNFPSDLLVFTCNYCIFTYYKVSTFPMKSSCYKYTSVLILLHFQASLTSTLEKTCLPTIFPFIILFLVVQMYTCSFP